MCRSDWPTQLFEPLGDRSLSKAQDLRFLRGFRGTLLLYIYKYVCHCIVTILLVGSTLIITVLVLLCYHCIVLIVGVHCSGITIGTLGRYHC